MTGIGENTLAQPVKPPLRERRACLAKLVKNRLTLTGVSTMLSLLLFHVPLSSYLGLVECQLFPSEPKDMVSTSFASMLFRLSHAATE